MSARLHKHSSVAATALEARSRELYRQAFLHSNEAIAILDPDGFYIEQNRAHRNLLGFSDDELEGMTPAIHMGEQMFCEVAAALRERGEYRG